MTQEWVGLALRRGDEGSGLSKARIKPFAVACGSLTLVRRIPACAEMATYGPTARRTFVGHVLPLSLVEVDSCLRRLQYELLHVVRPEGHVSTEEYVNNDSEMSNQYSITA